MRKRSMEDASVSLGRLLDELSLTRNIAEILTERYLPPVNFVDGFEINGHLQSISNVNRWLVATKNRGRDAHLHS